jgi:hypothetical protein
MKNAVQMGSGVMIYRYIPGFIMSGSGIQKIIVMDSHTNSMEIA